MDAARTLTKTALFLSAALAFAAPSFAQLLVNGSATTPSSPATVTLAGTAQQTVQISSSGAPVTFTYSVSYGSGFFFPVSVDKTTTTAQMTIGGSSLTLSCAALGVATCTATITVKNDVDGSDTATIKVGFTNGTGGGGGGGGAFTASQNSVSLAQGASTTITLFNNTAGAITYSVGTPTASWLFAYPTNSTFNIAANGNATLTITALNYISGQLNPASFTVTSGTTSIPITVTLTGVGTSGGLVPSPSTVALAYPGTPSSVAVTVTNAPGNSSSNFYAVAATSSGGQWMTLFPGAGTTSTTQLVGNQVLVAVNAVAAGLTTGTYNGTVTFYDGTTFQALGQASVTLSVNGAGGGTSGVAAPTSLSFGYQSSGSAPYQVILVNGNVTTATFTATGGSWTNGSVVPGFNSASNLVYISVPSGMTASGTPSINTGTVTVTNASGQFQQIPITLTVYPTGTPTLLVNSGSQQAQGDYICSYVAGQQPCATAVYQISVSEGSGVAISPSSTVNWATVSCSSPNTPSSCTVQVDASGLPNGLNSGQIKISANGTTNSPLTIPVTVLVSGNSGGSGSLTFSPTNLSFTTPSSSTATQQVAVTGTQGNVTFSITGTSNAWLTASAVNNNFTTPTSINVNVNTAGLATGFTQTGYVYFLVNGNPQQLLVNLTVGAGGSVQVTNSAGTALNSTTGLTFTGQQGGSAPAAQSITISSSSGSSGVPFTFSATTSTGSNWLLVNGMTSGSGATQTTLPVTVSPTGLTPSSTPYTGTVTITPTGGTAVSFPVSFTLTPASTVSASPTTMSFSYTAGSGNTPASQSITVSGNGTFSASATSTGNWCQVNPTSGTAPMSLTVSLSNLDSLAANQSYTCTIAVNGTGTTVGSTNVTVTLSVTAPLPTIIKVTNAASFNTGSIAAGEIITIFGTSIGPSTGVSATPTNGQFPTSAGLGGVQVLVAGFPAAMIYASATQVSAAVPYEINRPAFLQNVNVQVKYLGQTSNGIALTQVATAPGIFTANSSGSGPGAILNSNLSVNSPSNPASPGSTVVLYVTGEGQTIPAGVTGQVTPNSTSFIRPVQAPTVTINGQPAQVAFYAEAPTLIAGVLQINVVIPTTAGTGDLPVVVTIGNVPSQLTSTAIGAVTVSVR
jgi:uncharacterized protein (TIGR03437 family)